MVQIGWKAGTEQFPPADLLSDAEQAEQAGFDLVDISDHFHDLGTGATCPILRSHPAIIAQAAATLSCLVPERTYLGTGTAEVLNEYATTGTWPECRRRLNSYVSCGPARRSSVEGGITGPAELACIHRRPAVYLLVRTLPECMVMGYSRWGQAARGLS